MSDLSFPGYSKWTASKQALAWGTGARQAMRAWTHSSCCCGMELQPTDSVFKPECVHGGKERNKSKWYTTASRFETFGYIELVMNI